MHNIIEFATLVRATLHKAGCQLEHVEQWLTKEGTIYCKVKYHSGNSTKAWCKYITEDERKVLKRGTDMELLADLANYLQRVNTHES